MRLSSPLLLGALLLAALPLAAQPSPVTALRADRVIVGDGTQIPNAIVLVQGDRITVSVRTIVPMRILSLLGVTERSISVTRSAELVAG